MMKGPLEYAVIPFGSGREGGLPTCTAWFPFGIEPSLGDGRSEKKSLDHGANESNHGKAAVAVQRATRGE
jgi:hypothetical protein